MAIAKTRYSIAAFARKKLRRTVSLAVKYNLYNWPPVHDTSIKSLMPSFRVITSIIDRLDDKDSYRLRKLHFKLSVFTITLLITIHEKSRRQAH